MFSFIALAFFPVLPLPIGKQVWTIAQTSHDPVNVLLGDRLENNAAKVIFQKPYSRAGLNAVLAPQLCWNHKLALRGECSSWLSHVLHYSRGKSQRTYVGP